MFCSSNTGSFKSLTIEQEDQTWAVTRGMVTALSFWNQKGKTESAESQNRVSKQSAKTEKRSSNDLRKIFYCSLCFQIKNGARGRTRTGTVSLPVDFESTASTSFTTRAREDILTDFEWAIKSFFSSLMFGQGKTTWNQDFNPKRPEWPETGQNHTGWRDFKSRFCIQKRARGCR